MLSGIKGRFLLALITAVALVAGQPAPQRSGQVARAGSTYSAFLPLVINNLRIPSLFGIDMVTITSNQGLQKVSDSGATFVRQAAVEWSAVEATEGVYDWSSLSWLEAGLVNASQRGMKVVIVVRSTPSWAQLYSGVSCGPIKDTKLAAFGNFMYELVSRYSVPPYNGIYWEIWNEPDIDPDYTAADSLWGCWGDESDTTGFGGGYYADMLAAIYPRVKQANPDAQVIVGGLLLDCGPSNTNSCSQTPSQFLNGILAHNGADDGGNYFDGVSFHAYDYGGNATLGYYENPNWGSTASTTGPVLIAKSNFLLGVLDDYGLDLNDKFLMNTEAALLCNSNFAASECQTGNGVTTKSYYVTQAYAAAIAQGLSANIWYTNLGWRGSGLLDSGLNVLPAYNNFYFAYTQLAPATWFANFTGVTGVKGYKYHRTGMSDVWVLWSLDGATHNSVPLGATPSKIYDSDGTALTVTGSTTTVGLEPRYIIWP